MKIQPLDDRILVKPIEEPEKKVGGIIIPDTAKEKPQQGEVIAVGTDDDLKEKVKEHDIVLFAKYGGNEVKIDGTTYVILQRSDVLAILKPE